MSDLCVQGKLSELSELSELGEWDELDNLCNLCNLWGHLIVLDVATFGYTGNRFELLDDHFIFLTKWRPIQIVKLIIHVRKTWNIKRIIPLQTMHIMDRIA